MMRKRGRKRRRMQIKLNGTDILDKATAANANKTMNVMDVRKMIQSEIAQTLSNQVFNAQHSKVLMKQIVKAITKRMKSNKQSAGDYNCKYVVNVMILERAGAGFVCSSSCIWDKSTDTSTSAQWSNQTMFCVTTVWAARCH